MKRSVRILITAVVFVCCSTTSFARFGIEGFRSMYLTSGIPVDGTPVDRYSADVKFQISFAVPLWSNMGGVEGLNMKVGYTQKSVWRVYAPSSPFKDNTYEPGLYFDVPLKASGSNLLCGIEHRSNGRDDNLSRSVNFVFGEYTHTFPFGLSLYANARVGFGWYDETFTQDIFSRFFGYATVGAMYEIKGFSALVSMTPTFAPFHLGHTIELSYRPWKSELYHLFVQYHHGYDECFSDCVYNNVPGYNIRFGIMITAPGTRRLSQ